MKSKRETLVRLVLAAGLVALGHTIGATSNGLIFEDVILEDGATDGAECYYKIGKDLIFVAMPDSYECRLLEPLKGKKVEFRLVLR